MARRKKGSPTPFFVCGGSGLPYFHTRDAIYSARDRVQIPVQIHIFPRDLMVEPLHIIVGVIGYIVDNGVCEICHIQDIETTVCFAGDVETI